MLSKACLVGAYQTKLEAIARFPDVELTVIVPPSWDDPDGRVVLERCHPCSMVGFIALLIFAWMSMIGPRKSGAYWARNCLPSDRPPHP